jgi:hypothetical protein
MTVAGSGAGWQSKGWTISGNTINGGTQIAWATDIDYRNNTCTSSTGPCVYVYRASARVTISGNHLALTGSPKAVVSVYGTGPAQMPEQIVIAGNTLETGSANAHGVCILSAHSVEVTDNVMTGNGVAAPYTSGVYARATIAGGDAKIESLQIKRNKISNFPAYGVMLTGIPGTMGLVDVSTNFFASDNSAMPSALWIDDGFGGPDDVRQYANTFNGTMQRLIGRAPNGSKTVWLDGSRWVK